jgi:CheY-like chemotaxis protein
MQRIIQLLSGLSLSFMEAADGAEAIDFIQDPARAIDLLITDLDMPKRTGWHVIEALREHREGIPIIMQTGEAKYPWVQSKAAELDIVLIDKIHVDIRLQQAVKDALKLD